MRWLKTPWTLVALIVIGGLAALTIPRASSAPAPAPKLVGTILNGAPAPGFRLHDQFGRTVSLAQFRGRPVVLTFMEAHCTELCPLVAQSIHDALLQLGPAAKRIAVLAISVDPEGDTPAAVRTFSQQHGLFHTWHYLTASRTALAPIWRAYFLYVAPASAPAAVRDAHTSATYLIDSRGRERVLRAGALDQEELKRDLLILSGLPVSLRGPRQVAAPEVGHPAPDLTLAALKGPSLTLSAFRGKVVLLNFWATWCPPCRRESPLLAQWYRQLKKRGFVVLGVSEQDGAAAAAAFARSYHLSYPIALDGSGDLLATYNVSAMPTSFLIGRDGTIKAIKLGAVDDGFLKTEVSPLLGG
ncbi:MAG TPA: redoxin domain-containing protein [Chloroflexota bacterium]|nr:redoxin domain-containing protein [Chloroflexota bacterium]